MAVISDGFPLWPLHVARSVGLFEAERLDVDVTVTSSSVKQMNSLVQGEFDIGIQLPDHVVRAVGRGSDLFAFMAPVHAPDISLIVEPDVRSLGDLRQRTIAVDGARSGYALLLRKLLRGQGVGDAECRLVEFGGTRERLDALIAGRADAAFINPPFDEQLLAKGFVRLTSTLEAFPDYPGPVAAARRSWACDHEDLLVRFVHAYRNAFEWLANPEHREAAIGIACARLPVDPESASAAWADLAAKPEPMLSVAGMQQVIDVVWDSDGLPPPKPAAEKFIDLRYLD
ncbi:ABC transporter substrate-binding protein [Georgfuchsia toluolica]|uniref:ABC transporter substrate-binding protein n=1 Tax=Georgfuchsia toluolica TaxID=424218 RepID=UPI002484B4DF|nr:ABC transporter substrate-binding protein [Georgfuchsia toluolica]